MRWQNSLRGRRIDVGAKSSRRIVSIPKTVGGPAPVRCALRKSRRWSGMSTAATLLWLTLLVPAAPAQTASLRQQAQLLERQGRWYEACGLYDDLLSKDRNHPELREAFRPCFRHLR